MAFNDIKAWREIMDAEEQEKTAYDKACEDAEERAAKAARDEYDELEQTQVDPAACACDCGNDGCVCLDDLEDDEVDFSAYGVSESDLGVGPADEHYPTAHDLAREPLVRIPAALGRPASDADLAAQDVVSLMMEALKKAGRLNEINTETPTKYHNNFGADLLMCINGMDEKTFNGTNVMIELFINGKDVDISAGAGVETYKKGHAILRLGSFSLYPDKYISLPEFLIQLKNVGVRRLSEVEQVSLFIVKDTKYEGFSWDKNKKVILIRFDQKTDPDNQKTDLDNQKTDPDEWKKKYGDLLGEDSKKDFGDFLSEEDGALEKVDDKIKQMSQNDDYPLSDADWDEIDAEPSYQKKIEMIHAKVKDRWSSLSPEAKRQIRGDVDDLRRKFLESRWSEKQFEAALRLQRISRKRALTADEEKKFSQIVQFGLDDEQRERLENNLYSNGFRIPREGRTATVPASSAQASNVTDHHGGADSAERRNETGLDTEFDISKFEYVPEPMEPGTKVPADLNPEYADTLADRNAELRRDIAATAKELEPGHAERLKAWRRKEAADALGDDFYTDDAKVWKKLVGLLEPDEIAEITSELANELPGSRADNQRMLDYMFGGMKLTQTAMGAQAGYGADQKGRTGGLTQQGDKLMNLLLFALATHLNVATDYLERFWKNLKSENTDQRNVRKELRPVIFREICDELGVDLDRVGRELGVVPMYSAGVKAKRAADNLLITLFIREYDQMSAAEREALGRTFQAYKNNSAIVKLYTGLNDDQNSEFQDLIIRMRDEGDLPNEDRVRLLQLDLMRRNPGIGEDIAHAQAERKYAQMTQNGEGPFVEFTTRLAKTFVRGHSQNHTRDTIVNPNRAEA